MAVTTITPVNQATDGPALHSALQNLDDGDVIEIDGMLEINQLCYVNTTDRNVDHFVVRGKHATGCGFKYGNSGQPFYIVQTWPATPYALYADAGQGDYVVKVTKPGATKILPGDVTRIRSMDQIPDIGPHLSATAHNVPAVDRRVLQAVEASAYWELTLDGPIPYDMTVSNSGEFLLLQKSDPGMLPRFILEDLEFVPQGPSGTSPYDISSPTTLMDLCGRDFELNNIRVYGVGTTQMAGTGTLHDYRHYGWDQTVPRTLSFSTSAISSNRITTTSSHGFRSGDKFTYTKVGSDNIGITSGNGYYAYVIDYDTITVHSTFADGKSGASPISLTPGSGETHNMAAGSGPYTVLVGGACDITFHSPEIYSCGHAIDSAAYQASAGGGWPASGGSSGRGGCPRYRVFGGRITGIFNQLCDTHSEAWDVLYDGTLVEFPGHATGNGYLTNIGPGGVGIRSGYTTIRNCTVRSNATFTNGYGVGNYGPHTVIENCVFDGLLYGIQMYGSSYQTGAAVMGSKSVTIRNNVFRNIHNEPIKLHPLTGSALATTGLQIEGNRFESTCCLANANLPLIAFGNSQSGGGHVIRNNWMPKGYNTYSVGLGDSQSTSTVDIRDNNISGYSSNLGFTGTNAAAVSKAVSGINNRILR